jgi:hypothetical protein
MATDPSDATDLPISIIFVVCLVVFTIILSVSSSFSSASSEQPTVASTEPYINYARCDSAPVTGIMSDIFKTNRISKSGFTDSHLYYPCSYTNVEKEMRRTRMERKIIYAVDGCDLLASKNAIWQLLVDAYGRSESSTLMPETFITSDARELKYFLETYSPSQLYICKKNIQQKKGLLLTNNLDTLLQCQYRGFKVIQKYFRDVFLIHGRKLNLRLYVAVVCDVDGTRKAYLHRNGKCMYTNKEYNKNSTQFEEQITSVNLDTRVYDSLPLDFVDLQQTLWEDNGIRFLDDVYRPLRAKLTKMMFAVLPSLCTQAHLRSNVRFQLFGADVILTDTLQPYVLEFNKGPNMRSVNQRDYTLKRCVLEDILRLTHVIAPTSIDRVNGFTEIAYLPHGSF